MRLLLLSLCLLLFVGGGRYSRYSQYSDYTDGEGPWDSGLLADMVIPADGSFEVGASGWAVHSTPDVSELSTTRSQHGSQSWYVLTNAPNQGVRTENFFVTSGVDYTVTCRAYIEQGTMRIIDIGGSAAFSVTSSTTGEWHDVSVGFTATGTNNIQILWRSSVSVGEFYVDNIKVTSP